jgi:uncharacterized protein YifE (UPF0438 family)
LHPPEHAALLARHDFAVPPGDAFTPEERELLQKYGRWLEALAAGTIAPTTAAQEQFVRVARGGGEPATDFERVWAKFAREWAVRDVVVRTFQTLARARADRARAEEEYSAAREAVLARVREQLDAVDEQFAHRLAETTAAAAEAEQALRGLVAQVGRSITLAGIKATYASPRVTWDTPGLDAYARDHPEVRAFRKVGKPTVALRFLDVNPAVRPVAAAAAAIEDGGVPAVGPSEGAGA